MTSNDTFSCSLAFQRMRIIAMTTIVETYALMVISKSVNRST